MENWGNLQTKYICQGERNMKMSNMRNLCLILLGNTVYALAIVMFILPNDIITGGTTGLGIAVNHYFGLQNVTDDKMLSTICGGLMIGLGIGVVIRCGASTGGMDIPPLVLNKKFGLPVSVMLYVFDFAILIFQMVFTNKEEIIYGILLVLIYTVMLDKVLLMGSTRTQVKIISGEYEKLNHLIQEKLDRGTTLVYTQTGYLRKYQPIILTVVSNRELMRLNQIVQETDPQAFMIIGNVNEVRGRGFSTQKVYKNEVGMNE